MRHWEHHRTRSKVALLLLINLVALLGGKYMALITIVKIELFGEAMAFAKAPKKKLSKPHLNRAQRGHSPQLAITWTFPVLAGEQPRPRERLHGLAPVKRCQRSPPPMGSASMPCGEGIACPLRRILSSERRCAFPPPWAPQPSPSHISPPPRARPPSCWPCSAMVSALPRHRLTIPAMVSSGRLMAKPMPGPFGEREHAMGGGRVQFHAGIDIECLSPGTPAVGGERRNGGVCGNNGAYGKVVKLEHANGFSTLYAHNSRLLVYVGQAIAAGQVILPQWQQRSLNWPASAF